MERRINKKIENYISDLKENVKKVFKRYFFT